MSGIPRKRRRAHTNSRSGCLPCKQRHIRCDEGRPVCARCLKRGIGQSCSFLASTSVSRRSSLGPESEANTSRSASPAFLNPLHVLERESDTSGLALPGFPDLPLARVPVAYDDSSSVDEIELYTSDYGLPIDGSNFRAADPSAIITHVDTPSDWSRNESHLMFDLTHLIDFVVRGDTNGHRNVLDIDIFAQWAKLSFQHPFVRNALVAYFAPAFPNANVGKGMTLARHIQLAVAGLQVEISRLTEDNIEVVEAASLCLQSVHGVNKYAKEWHMFALGVAQIRRLMQRFKDPRIIRPKRFLPPREARTINQSERIFGSHRIWKPGSGSARDLATQRVLTHSFLYALHQLEQCLDNRRGQRGAVSQIINTIKTCRNSTVPTTPEQRLWFWHCLEPTVGTFPAQCVGIVEADAVDILIGCFIESVPLLFPHIFFPDMVLSHLLLSKKENTGQLYDYLSNLPTDGDGICPLDKATLLEYASPAYYAATTFPSIPDPSTTEIGKEWDEFGSDRVYELETDDDDTTQFSIAANVHPQDKHTEGMMVRFLQNASKPYSSDSTD